MQTLPDQLQQYRVKQPIIRLICALSKGVKVNTYLLKQEEASLRLDSHNQRHHQQLKADVDLDNSLRLMLNSYCPDLAPITISEESGMLIGNPQATYLIPFDSLDGSKNLKINGPVGTIAMIVKLDRTSGRSTICASMAATYGRQTDLFVATPGQVDGYTFNETADQFVLNAHAITIPDPGKILCLGKPAVSDEWSPQLRKHVAELEANLATQKQSLRNFGSFVCDTINLLYNGGTIAYPKKLSFPYEVAPMAFMIKQAGGDATDGELPILDQLPQTEADWRKNWQMETAICMGSPTGVASLLPEVLPIAA